MERRQADRVWHQRVSWKRSLDSVGDSWVHSVFDAESRASECGSASAGEWTWPGSIGCRGTQQRGERTDGGDDHRLKRLRSISKWNGYGHGFGAQFWAWRFVQTR